MEGTVLGAEYIVVTQKTALSLTKLTLQGQVSSRGQLTDK